MRRLELSTQRPVDQTVARPLILSASRRTDLPGFHSAECARRIEDRIARLRTRQLYGVVFWTRHVRPFLPGGDLHALVTRPEMNPIINLTVTGLGGTALEPGVPGTDEVLAALPALVETLRGDGFRVRWRFDPILARYGTLENFDRIGGVMSGCGVEVCLFSFPIYRSLKGDLTPQFLRAGIPRWDPEAQTEFLAGTATLAGNFRLRLLSCCQPESLQRAPGIEAASCIPRDVLERGHPHHTPLDLPLDRGQRKECHCIESEDIGRYYTDMCRGGCAYCYSKAGGPSPAE